LSRLSRSALVSIVALFFRFIFNQPSLPPSNPAVQYWPIKTRPDGRIHLFVIVIVAVSCYQPCVRAFARVRMPLAGCYFVRREAPAPIQSSPCVASLTTRRLLLAGYSLTFASCSPPPQWRLPDSLRLADSCRPTSQLPNTQLTSATHFTWRFSPAYSFVRRGLPTLDGVY